MPEQRIEFDYYITPDGVEYDLNDWGRTFLISQGGQGAAPIEYRTSRGPFQHGETALDYVLRPRVLQYLFRIDTRNRAKYWEERTQILNIFRPNRQTGSDLAPGQLVKMLEDRTQRAIDVFVDQGLEFKSGGGDWDEFASNEVVRFIAYNPVWYDPGGSTQIFSLGELSHLVFPITFPIQFGSTIINSQTTITYSGTWEELPIIVITGPLQAPVIENLTTGESLELNYNVPAGRTVTIDLTYGRKTITDDLGTNLVGALSADSDLATFHLAPDPEAPLGANEFLVTGTGAEPTSTRIEVQYYNRYGGI